MPVILALRRRGWWTVNVKPEWATSEIYPNTRKPPQSSKPRQSLSAPALALPLTDTLLLLSLNCLPQQADASQRLSEVTLKKPRWQILESTGQGLPHPHPPMISPHTPGHYRFSHLSRLQQPELSSGLGSHHEQGAKRSLRICNGHSAADPNSSLWPDKPYSDGLAITLPPLCSLDPTCLLTSHPRPPRTLVSPCLKETRKSKDMGRCPSALLSS